MLSPSATDVLTTGFAVRVESVRSESEGIIAIELAAVEDGTLPSWSPGDHIDLSTPEGVRQYSLCGPLDSTCWTIGVHRDPARKAASHWLHQNAQLGLELIVSPPRNTFGFRQAPQYLFIAGGIGVTPLLPMVEQAERQGADWRLAYTARSSHAFASRLPPDERVILWTSGSHGRLDIAPELNRLGESAEVYCCGPAALIEAVRDREDEYGLRDRFHVERFSAPEQETGSQVSFEMVLSRSGAVLVVPPERTALDVLNEAGVFVPSSCRSGICGSCETPVIAGRVEHRDSILTAAEREENSCFFPCASRSSGGPLILDV